MAVVQVTSFVFKGMTFYKRVEWCVLGQKHITTITTVPNPVRRRKAA